MAVLSDFEKMWAVLITNVKNFKNKCILFNNATSSSMKSSQISDDKHTEQGHETITYTHCSK